MHKLWTNFQMLILQKVKEIKKSIFFVFNRFSNFHRLSAKYTKFYYLFDIFLSLVMSSELGKSQI